MQIYSITHVQHEVNSTLLSAPISAFVDSTLLWLYLPRTVCEAFETAFGIEYENLTAGYPINDTFHEKLEADNASVTFTLLNPAQTGQMDVTLPYAGWPIIQFL